MEHFSTTISPSRSEVIQVLQNAGVPHVEEGGVIPHGVSFRTGRDQLWVYVLMHGRRVRIELEQDGALLRVGMVEVLKQL